MSNISIESKTATPFVEYINELGMELASILDMDEIEGHIYLTLLRTGPISASALAKELGIDRAKAYRIIDKLSNEGFVSISFSSPKMCIAIDPENALSLILEKKELEIKKIQNVGKKIIKRVKDTVVPNYGSNVPSFRIIQGSNNIFSNIEKILEYSSDITYIVATSEDIAKMFHSNVPEKISKLKKKGLKVRMIIDAFDEQMIPFLGGMNPSEIKLSKLPSKGIVVVSKNNQLLMSRENELSKHVHLENDYAIITNASEMVDNIFQLNEFLWEASKGIDLKKQSKF